MQKRWKTFPDATAEAGALARSLGVSDTLARLLWNREIRTEEAARRFLEPETRQVPVDSEIIRTGRQLGICFGD